MKKGFTLVELLAVIVILAIIALIATPIVLNIIENSKVSSSLISAENYLDAVEIAIANSASKGNNVDGTYVINTKGKLCKNNNDCLNVEVEGDAPISGTILISNGSIVGVYRLQISNQYISRNFQTGELVIVNSNVSKWDGSSATPYEDLTIENGIIILNSAADLVGLRNAINSKASESYKVVLNTDIDLNGEVWTPIGSIVGSYDETLGFFSGEFDGNGFTISNFEIESTSGSPIGFFGGVAGDTVIKNLTLESGTITTTGKTAGGIIGYSVDKTNEKNNLSIINCNTNLLISTQDAGAGIIARAYNSGTTNISNCVNNSTIGGPINVSNRGKIAGIISLSSSENLIIQNCVNNGIIKNGTYLGGILAYNDSVASLSIDNCTNNAVISKENDEDFFVNAGGIVGFIYNVSGNQIKNCVNNAKISATNRAGGIVGSTDSTIASLDSNINNGKINSDTYAGGILGYNKSWKTSVTVTINDSINKGDVSAVMAAGGIVGQLDNSGNINDCLNTAKITSSTGNIGGLIGVLAKFGSVTVLQSNIKLRTDRIGENTSIDTIGYMDSTTGMILVCFTNGTPIWTIGYPKTSAFGSKDVWATIRYDGVDTFIYKKDGGSGWTVKPS